MYNQEDYKQLQSKTSQPTSSQDWAVRLSQLLTEHTDALPEELKAHLGNYRHAIQILSNDIIRKALQSQRIAIAAHFNSLGQHDAASSIAGH